MKQFFLNQLQIILKWLAAAIIRKYGPGVIAVTGSVGKTSTKEAVYAVLKDARKVRCSRGNFNNELGLPLTVIGDWERVEGPFFWLKVLASGIALLLKTAPYPEMLILEYGVQKPGDMKYLLDIARPFIGIVTAIGEIPVHVEYFASPEALAREKGKLVEAIGATGFAILNNDDARVAEMESRVRCHATTFGFAKGAHLRIGNFANKLAKDGSVGIAFKLEYGGNVVPVRIDGVFGKAHAYAAAAAACVGLVFGVNLVKVGESLAKHYKPAKRRMNVFAGPRGALVIDDSYNAAPLSMQYALEAVKSLKAKRKIGVLGDMLELGAYTKEAHTRIGEMAGKIFDVLIAVGSGGKTIAEQASAKGGIPKKNTHLFAHAAEARDFAKDLLKGGDLVLIKASRGIGLDIIADALRAPIV